MAERPILKLGVDDARFKTLAADLEKFNKTVAAQPDLWKGLNAETKKTELLLMHMASSLLTITDNTKKVAANENEVQKHVRSTASFWSNISRDSKTHLENIRATATHIRAIGTDLLRWTGLTSVFGSIFGIGGGMFALDRLALSASAGLRSSTGQGIGYGQQQAFGLSYGKYVNAGGFLGGISQARGNLGSPAYATLRALGVDPAQGNSGDVANRTMEALHRLAHEAPNENELGNIVQGRQLGNIDVDVDTLRRLRRLSPDQFKRTQTQFNERSSQIDVDANTLDKWQEFLFTLDTAGEKIKSSLIKGLVGLTDPLTKLTEAFSSMIKRVLEGEGFKWVIDKLTSGLKSLADYIGSPSFKEDLQAIFDFFKYWAQKFGIINGNSAAGGFTPTETYESFRKRFFEMPLHKGKEGDATAEQVLRQDYNSYLRQQGQGNPSAIFGGGPNASGINANGQRFLGGIVGDKPINNPGGMRGPGGKGFLQFTTADEGLTAAYKNLVYYQDKEGRKTINDIVDRWAPPNENNTEAYKQRLEKLTGFRRNQALNMHDFSEASQILSAITSVEGMRFYSPAAAKVVIDVNQNTGGATATTVNAMRTGQ